MNQINFKYYETSFASLNKDLPNLSNARSETLAVSICIFNVGIPIQVARHLYIKTAPWVLCFERILCD